MAQRTVTVDFSEFKDALDNIGELAGTNVLINAGLAGTLPILESAKERVHFVSGTLRRSLRQTANSTGPGRVIAKVGSNLDYAEEEELRAGTKKGSTHAFLRPAFDIMLDDAIEETAAALRFQLVKRV